MKPLLRQGRPLGDAEAVLLIRHHEPQIPEADAPRDQGVGADGKVDATLRQGRPGLPFGLGAGGTRQQCAAEA